MDGTYHKNRSVTRKLLNMNTYYISISKVFIFTFYTTLLKIPFSYFSTERSYIFILIYILMGKFQYFQIIEYFYPNNSSKDSFCLKQ